MNYTHAERQEGNPGAAPRTNGAWFAGWGFMRFWESKRDRVPMRQGVSNVEGEGDEPIFSGCVEVDVPSHNLPSALGASPAEYEMGQRLQRRIRGR